MRGLFKPSRLVGVIVLCLWAGVMWNLKGRGAGPTRADAELVFPWLADRSKPGEEWLGAYLKGRKIGYVHNIRRPAGKGYELTSTSFLNLRVMGTRRRILTTSRARLTARFELVSFGFKLTSGGSRFAASGKVKGRELLVTVQTGGSFRKLRLPLRRRAVLPLGLKAAIARQKPKPNKKYQALLFDPQSLSYRPMVVVVVGREKVKLRSGTYQSLRLRQTFRGVTIHSWIDSQGNTLKEVSPLGLSLEKVSRREALRKADPGGADLIVSSRIPVGSIPRVTTRRSLKLRLSGADLAGTDLHGGRQKRQDRVVTIVRQTVPKGSKYAGPEVLPKGLPSAAATALRAGHLVQSDHPKIRRLAALLVRGQRSPVGAARAIANWVHTSVRKANVLGVPSALETLKTKKGDCNEHAVLTAALLRAAKIPTRVVAGLAYRRGAFYFHAWNEVYLSGRWIAVDTTWGQFPADVSHLRFAIGGLERQVVLLRLLGRLRIEVLKGR